MLDFAAYSCHSFLYAVPHSPSRSFHVCIDGEPVWNRSPSPAHSPSRSFIELVDHLLSQVFHHLLGVPFGSAPEDYDAQRQANR